MNYAELNTLVNTVITEMGLDYIHSTDDQVNTYQGDFPLAVLFPPSSSGVTNDGDMFTAFSVTYDLQIAFMERVSGDRTYVQSRIAVANQWTNAATFVAKLVFNDYDNNDNTHIRRVRIDPFFQFSFSSHITSGVMLSLDIETADTLNWCAV